MTAPGIRPITAPIDTGLFAPVEHDFAGHPAMTMAALRALAHRLCATGQCRAIPPQTTQASAFDHQPAATDSAGIDRVFDAIDQPGAWLALYNVESDPQYAAFLDQVRVAFEPLIAPEQTGVYNVGGFVFISCAPSVTPFHIDRENNFWLQIQGNKTISVWPANDPAIISNEASEKFILNRDLDAVKLRDSIASRRHDFPMSAGNGLYFPSLTPHMTRFDSPADGVSSVPSISVGVVFYTDQTRQASRILALNRILRRAGFSPRPPKRANALQPAPLRDRLKALGGQAAISLMSLLRDYKPPPGL